MTSYPVISLKPSYNSVIRGCPGIPDTLPRIECQLQIKSNNGSKINIEKIEILLKTVETLHSNYTISLPSPSSVPSPFERPTFLESSSNIYSSDNYHRFSSTINNHDTILSRHKKKKKFKPLS